MKWTNLSAGPIQVKRFNSAWNELGRENNTFVELTGTKGEKESSCTLWSPFSPMHREDVTAAKNKIGEAYQWTVTRENVNEIIKAIQSELPALKANRPVNDKRQTPEQRAETNAKVEEATKHYAEKSALERKAFLEHYSNGETVTVKPGEMAVTARITYNNSDPMTDYFDSHVGLSPRFALMVVPRAAETEKLARRAVAGCAMLRDLPFEWHTEKYSMGHGNYLEQKGGFELPPELQNVCNYYRGGPVTHGGWEIEFEKAYKEPKTLPVAKGIPVKEVAYAG